MCLGLLYAMDGLMGEGGLGECKGEPGSSLLIAVQCKCSKFVEAIFHLYGRKESLIFFFSFNNLQM